MPQCRYVNCTNYTNNSSSPYCNDHLTDELRRQANGRLKQQKADEQKAEEQRRKNEEVQKKANKQEEIRKKQGEAIDRHRTEWNSQINRVVTEVLRLREKDQKANAGRNGVGNTKGGTSNPVELKLTGETHGITKADVLNKMEGFESSDSGSYKFRRKDVLVHCC